MHKLNLHSFRSQSAPLKYVLVLSLLFSIGLSIFADWHNPAHVLKTDQHCALCISAANLDNSIPPQIPYFAYFPSAIARPSAETYDYYLEVIGTTGNRDPPSIS